MKQVTLYLKNVSRESVVEPLNVFFSSTEGFLFSSVSLEFVYGCDRYNILKFKKEITRASAKHIYNEVTQFLNDCPEKGRFSIAIDAKM